MNKEKEHSVIKVSEINIKGIPLILMSDSKKNIKPVIFVFHRLLKNKLNELPLSYALARNGYFIVAMDMHGHGERERSFDREKNYQFDNLFEDIYRTANDVNQIIKYLETYNDAKLDFNDIGSVGVSIGGSVALVTGYLIREIKYVVSIIGACNWEYLAKNRLFEPFRFFSKDSYIMKYENVKGSIEKYGPCNNFNMDNMLPILFMNGKMDTTVPINVVDQYYEKLRLVFREKGKEDYLEFKSYNRAGHEITEDMIEDLLYWLNNKDNLWP